MRIGLDLDNVIVDFDKYMLKAFIKEDKKKRNKGIINKNADYIFSGMFDWSTEEVEEFLTTNLEDLSIKFKCIKNARKYINKLHKNNEIYIITNRCYPHYKNAYYTTLKWLKEKKVKYDKIIFTDTNDKSSECNKYKIDIMVDDRLSNLKCLKNIKCYLFKSRYEKRVIKEFETVSSWKTLYKKLKKEGA